LWLGFAIYVKKKFKKKKKEKRKKEEEELWKLKYFIMQKYNLQKKSSKRNQNPSRYYNTKTKSQVSTQLSQNIIFQTSSYKNK
jgi:hypothetical protein